MGLEFIFFHLEISPIIKNDSKKLYYILSVFLYLAIFSRDFFHSDVKQLSQVHISLTYVLPLNYFINLYYTNIKSRN